MEAVSRYAVVAAKKSKESGKRVIFLCDVERQIEHIALSVFRSERPSQKVATSNSPFFSTDRDRDLRGL